MSDKVFQVGFKVRQQDLHDLLLALPQYKVGDLNVHAVPPELLALPAPDKVSRTKHGRTRTGQVRDKIYANFPIGKRIRVATFAKELGIHPTSTNSALLVMVQRKLAKKVGPGLFVRTKLTEAQSNGAAS